MKDNTFEKAKKIILYIFMFLIVAIFVVLLITTKDSQLIKEIKEFVKTDTKVLYISNKKEYKKYPLELLNKYEIEYLYIDSSTLDNFEQTKLENLINSKYLSNIVVIYKSGKVVDAIIDYEDKESLNKFLQKNNIIPQILGDVKGIQEDTLKLIDTDYTMIYLPYQYDEDINNQDDILFDIAKNNGIEYKKIDAYLLSNTQKEKLNKILKISEVENQIVILVKNKEIIGSIRDKKNYYEYLNILFDYKYIQNNKTDLKEISYNEFKEIILDTNKNIIVIGKEDCKYCDEVISTLEKILYNKEIYINYINIEDFESEVSKNIEKTLKELEYNDGFTTPITLITESNKLLDYVIGSSSEEYFIEIFKENGIIKEEVKT